MGFRNDPAKAAVDSLMGGTLAPALLHANADVNPRGRRTSAIARAARANATRAQTIDVVHDAHPLSQPH